MKSFFLMLIGVFVLSGCTTPDEPYAERAAINAPVGTIIKSFDRAAIGIRGKSPNGRELVSKYHSPGGDGYDYAATNPERAYSKLKILGERRPYTLRIQYIVEVRNDQGVYSVKKYDQRQAKKVLKALVDDLVTRPDREDFIDDFRPF